MQNNGLLLTYQSLLSFISRILSIFPERKYQTCFPSNSSQLQENHDSSTFATKKFAKSFQNTASHHSKDEKYQNNNDHDKPSGQLASTMVHHTIVTFAFSNCIAFIIVFNSNTTKPNTTCLSDSKGFFEVIYTLSLLAKR